MADTPKGETVTPAPLGNDVTPPSVPTPPAQDNTKDTSEVDKLKAELKEAQQKAMRVNQVENELAKIKEAEEKKSQAELEENNQFKELFEQEKVKREALEQDQQAKERETELNKARQEVLADFSEEVRTLADEVGLDLTGADEAAVENFKEKLSKISEKVSSEVKITPNNPRSSSPNTELSTEELRTALQDENSFHDLVTKKYPGIAAMTQPKR